MIKGIHHACVIVSDMDRSLDFYRDKLGLKEVMNLKFDADPAMMERRVSINANALGWG